MKRFSFFRLPFSLFVLCLSLSATIYPDATTAYVTAFNTIDIYSVDLTTGNSSLLHSGMASNGIALENPTLAYVTSFVGNNLYQFNITTGSFSLVNPSPIAGAGLGRLQLADSMTAYVDGSTDGNIYRVNLLNGSVFKVTPTPLATGPIGLALEMTLTNPKVAYVAAINGSVYRFDLTNGNFSQVTSIPGTSLRGLSLLNNTTAYVTDTAASNVYSVDLVSGSYSLVTPSPITGAALNGLVLANSNSAYTVGSGTNEVYRIDLTNGSYFQVTPSPILSDLTDIALVVQIGTAGLHGNNLKFANYLNNNAPFLTLPLIALQPDVAGALEIASPVRNAISTFAAQTTQLAFGRLVADHLGQRRWGKAWHQGESIQPTPAEMTAEAPYNRHQLVADVSDAPVASDVSDAPDTSDTPMDIQDETKPSASLDPSPLDSSPKEQHSPTLSKGGIAYSPWLAGIGEYAREQKQRQTPAFEAGAGGFVLALDCYGAYPELLLGSGIAYAHTHVHEDDGFGHANVDQGAVVLYAAWGTRDYYFNMELWGSGYHTKNVREVNLPGVIGGSAISSTNGWQLTPHLEVGYDYKEDWFCIEPFTMFDWVANWEGGLQEHGAGKLNMGQKGRFCSLFRNEWGLRFNETLSYDWGTVTLREKGSYAYQKAFHTGRLTAFLVGSSGTFVVSTLNGAQNLGVVELESLFAPRNRKYPYGTISYQGEFGSRYQSHQGMATIGMDF